MICLLVMLGTVPRAYELLGAYDNYLGSSRTFWQPVEWQPIEMFIKPNFWLPVFIKHVDGSALYGHLAF